LTAQAIYSQIEIPTQFSASQGGIRSLAGWALDCELGSLPPLLRIVETKPDGSMREVPNDLFFNARAPRPDVFAQIQGTCPAVTNIPAGDGSGGLGPSDGFGWSLSLRSPITEIGVHTFTVIWSWPAQNHSGSSSLSVTIVP
jgi:hypothetical protein